MITIKDEEKSVSCETRQKAICPKFEHTFAILGKKWMGLIIDVLLEGPQRFKDIAATIPNVSDRVLVERLKELEQEGLVARTVDPDATMRVAYSLTEKGHGLKEVMADVQKWADKWVCVQEA
ncbi:winged helix-turn-helix transcriptional regulator [Carnobacterium inhibens]|uniref:HxlR family transcriptional regulator n=1 Tax=Carnobacterium inhibens subsp. gilichinskyi TaxID=1266845 RepID=U5S827_9LACT|nr:helix-turn-helix domain-containing protein [Carnobacterium inhibens]AGY81191.1 HxlR family transcriptional regulator [Carnobacterium inhibens subsp. gilichinskyi]